MISSAARLVMPAIRWGGEGQGGAGGAASFAPAAGVIADGLELGVGGFIIFGGERAAVRALTADLAAKSAHPLLVASDLERGAGQQVAGLTPLPPLAALASLGEEAVVEAARMTAREALDVGINWVFAPVCDLDLEPANPIVQTRSFGADAFQVGQLAARWVEVCQAEGVLACAKHFPGHGRTTVDSHATLPVVQAGPELGRDILPFRRAVHAGVATVMTAHVAYPGWDPAGTAATFSRALITGLLRHDLFFDGLVVTDALIMEGANAGEGGEAAGARRVIEAGGDVLLYPRDPRAAAKGLANLDVLSSLRRLDAALARARPSAPPAVLDDVSLARHRARGRDLAWRAVQCVRGEWAAPARGVRIEIVDDDAGGPYPLPPRSAFGDALAKHGVRRREDGPLVVLLFADVKGWKGRAGVSDRTRARLDELCGGEDPPTVVLFGHPRRLGDVPGEGPVLCAWSGDAVMQEAAARALAEGVATA